MNDIFNVSDFLCTIIYVDDTCVLSDGKKSGEFDYLNKLRIALIVYMFTV